MTENDCVRKSVDATIADIARIQAEMGHAEICYQAEDCEAREIIRRIERRMAGRYGGAESQTGEAADIAQ